MAIRARWALAGAAGCIALLAATWFAAFHISLVTHADQSIFSGFYDLHTHGDVVHATASFIAHLCDPVPYVYLVTIPIIVALARRRPGLALAVVVILIGANVTTEQLKALLAEPRAAWLLGGMTPVVPKSWPSGHATAVMSLALASVLVSTRRWRPVVAAAGAVFVVAVCYSFLTLGWHYPSDVLGGFLVATAWTLVVIAGLRLSARRSARDSHTATRVSLGELAGPVGTAVAAAVALAGIVLVSRPHQVVAYAQGHRAFVVGAAAIAAAGFALPSAIALTVRR